MKSLFFSYGHDCEEIVLRIKDDLEQKGYKVWLDKDAIQPGTDWQEGITRGILDCDLVFAFMSAKSLRRDSVCMSELALAVGYKEGNICTFLLEPGIEKMIPASISRIQYFDFSEWAKYARDKQHGYEEWYQTKINALSEYLQRDDVNEMNEQLQKLQQILSPEYTFSRCQTELQKTFISRKDIERNIDKWITKQKETPFFLLYGDPGTGKSAFSAHYFHFDSRVVSTVFCENWNIDEISQAQLIRTIAFQMASKLPTYRQRLCYILDQNGSIVRSRSLKELFVQLILNPIAGDITILENDILIIIDGIDETTNNYRNTLAGVISDCAGIIPRGMRFLITSRNDAIIQRHFSGFPSLILDQIGAQSYQYIYQYLEQQLGRELEGYDQIHRCTYLDSMVSHCENSFLYAEMLVRSTRMHGLALYEEDTLPGGLDANYYNWFTNTFKEDDYLNEYYDLISVLAAWKYPVPFSILAKITGDKKPILRRKMQILSPFLGKKKSYLGEDGYYFFHRSFREWLVNDASGMYQTDPEEGMRLLTETMFVSCQQGSMNEYEVFHILEALLSCHRLSEARELANDVLYIQSLIEFINQYEAKHVYSIDVLEICRKTYDLCESADIKQQLMYQIARALFQIENYDECLSAIEKICDDELDTGKKLDLLSIVTLVYDRKGRRAEAVELAKKLYQEAVKADHPVAALTAYTCLVWNDHFNDLPSARKRLDAMKDNRFTPEEKFTYQLCQARVKLSQGNLKDALRRFGECINDWNSYRNREIDSYTMHRNRMLMIEILPACFDNEQYQQGIEIGEELFHILQGEGWLEECYCSSWLSLNHWRSGNLPEAKNYLAHAMLLNGMMEEIASSAWIEMHLTSIRAFLEETEGKQEEAVKHHRFVRKMAEENSDIWVWGDADFEILKILKLSGSISGDEEELICELQDLADRSKLPNLLYKSALIQAWFLNDPEKAESARLYRIENTPASVNRLEVEKIEKAIMEGRKHV